MTSKQQWGATPSDPFDAVKAQPLELPSKFVSTTTVDVGEGLKFAVSKFEVIPDRFSDDEDGKVGEITGIVLESRAHRFADGQELVITCKAVALERLANEVPQIDDVITLVLGEPQGKAAGWRYAIERGQTA